MNNLEAIFDGEYEAVNSRRPQSQEYDDLNKKMISEMEHWEKTMSAEDYQQLEYLVDIIAGMQKHDCFESFKAGISLAVDVVCVDNPLQKG